MCSCRSCSQRPGEDELARLAADAPPSGADADAVLAFTEAMIPGRLLEASTRPPCRALPHVRLVDAAISPVNCRRRAPKKSLSSLASPPAYRRIGIRRGNDEAALGETRRSLSSAAPTVLTSGGRMARPLDRGQARANRCRHLRPRHGEHPRENGQRNRESAPQVSCPPAIGDQAL